MTIDLNADVGEGFPWDEELMGIVTSGNVCLGGHAGSRELTLATAERWLAAGKTVGMHPGYPDRETMGRRSPTTIQQAKKWVADTFVQSEWARRQPIEWGYLKPHGAFYGDSAQKGLSSAALGAALQHAKVPLLGLARTVHEWEAQQEGVAFFREGFADRRYDGNGTLVPRSEPAALIESDAEAAEQAVRLAFSGRFDSLCLHGDQLGCVDRARAVRNGLEAAGFTIAPFVR